MRSRIPRGRRALWLGLGLLALVLIAGAVTVLSMSGKPGDVSNPSVPFASTTTATVAHNPPAASFSWPVYGFTKARTRYLPLAQPLRPPFAERWALHGKVLLEFPPALGGRSLYLLKNDGALYALSRQTGRVRWTRKLGYLAASSPAYSHGTVYAVLLQRGNGVRQGRVVAVDATSGRTRWSVRLPSRAESSPLITGDDLIFGSEDGTVYDLRASDGFTRWKTKLQGAVKGGLAYDGSKLYVGDYSGRMHALRARDGHQVWTKGTSGQSFGRSGTFYSTPAVAYGRVYIGNTDGFVYSYATKDGRLAWRRQTGGYVYGSPAVAQVPGGKPTVYVGSYDGRFYALNAQSGAVRWQVKARGKISGGATVLGDLVFFSTLNGTTAAVGARTGHEVWATQRGKFNAVVSNGRGIFLLGSTTLYGLDGRPPAPTSAERAAAKQRAAEQAANHRRAVAERRHDRYVAERIAARRRLVARRNRQIREGVRFCAKVGGTTVCRRPKPLVCVKVRNGQTVCRAKR